MFVYLLRLPPSSGLNVDIFMLCASPSVTKIYFILEYVIVR